jgi:hypothetical protein
MEEKTIIEASPRKRVNVGFTASGKLTWDLTVELFNKSNDEIIAEVLDLKQKLTTALEKPQ